MKKYTRFKFQPCLPIGADGRRVTASAEHALVSKQAASEGMVLLKNENGALPLKKGEKIALFGKCSVAIYEGGGGSGEIHAPYKKNIFDGFEEKAKERKVRLYTGNKGFYEEHVRKEQLRVTGDSEHKGKYDDEYQAVQQMPMGDERINRNYELYQLFQVAEPELSAEDINVAASEADTAIITIGRISSEGLDRRAIAGDYYLSNTEKKLIDDVCAKFEKVIVVLNITGVTDVEYIAENPKISAILVSWFGGMEGGSAVADILCGDVTPSGKLTDTFVKSYDFYPTKDTFEESLDYMNYTDDIYVGYRYFETIPDAKDTVRYPFGFGLSYTNFEVSNVLAGEEKGLITVSATVKNTGSYAGKEVVQVYFSAPQGKLGKPAKQLIGYKKTKLLNPEEFETVAISFKVNDMASFDDLGKIEKSAYVLEKGDYEIYLGNSVRDCAKQYKYTVNEDIVTEKLSSLCPPCKLEKRMLADGSFEALSLKEESFTFGVNTPNTAKAPEKETSFELVGDEITLDEFIAQLTDEELVDLVGGHPSTGVADTGCFGANEKRGIPAVPTADGPAGLRLIPNREVRTTAYPSGTLLACTWNPEIIYKVGECAAKEVKENNIGVWLTPALNIHTNPLCGRNFEYFSEDPFVAGKAAAALTKGVQSQKIAVSAKHFAANNKEVNRTACDSRVSERALREIYLKGFEICVKEADPWTIMTSYNLLNGCHTSESYDLITGILRNEWGFKGMITTDWGVKNDPVKEVKAGNDMKMHIGYPDELKEALTNGSLTRADLEACVKRILELFLKLD